MTYQLKSFLNSNYSKQSAELIYQDLSKSVESYVNLTALQLQTLLCQHPQIWVRLKRLALELPEEDSSLINAWAIATTMLKSIENTDLRSSPCYDLELWVSTLLSSNVLSKAEAAIFTSAIVKTSNYGEQVLGFVPTIEQIKFALSMESP